jgi:hypothetical protein
MSACTTSVPDGSTTLTGTTSSTPSVIESKSRRLQSCLRPQPGRRLLEVYLDNFRFFEGFSRFKIRLLVGRVAHRLTVQPCRRR